MSDVDYSINWFHMIKHDLSLLTVHFFTRWPLAASHDGRRMKTRCGWMVTTASCFILFESVDELINIRWKILSHTKSTEYTDFTIQWALSLELLRSFARRTHRGVSDAYVNTAPAVVAKLATNSVGSNTLAKCPLEKNIIWEIREFCVKYNLLTARGI